MLKETNIDWLGKIPQNWELKRLQYLCSITTGNKDTINRDDDGAYPFFVRSKNIERINSYSYDGKAILTAGDGDICKIWHYIDGKFDFHQRVYMLYDFKIEPKFLYYYISENFYHDVYKLSAKNTVDSLRRPMFDNFPVVVPPIEIQTRITNFLDKKTTEIDTIIAKKEKLLGLLEEKKKAIINEVVTKGLNTKATMKDSGIEWIGEIPEHWEITQLKYLTIKVGSGVTPKGGAEVYSDEGIKFIRSQNVYFEGLRLDDVVFIDEKIHNQMENSKVNLNDVLLNITGGSIGRSCIVDIESEFNVNQHVCIIRPNEKLLPEFLNFALFSNLGQIQIRLGITGGNREGLNFENIKNFYVPNISIKEQKEIVCYLNIKNDELNLISTKISTQINKLKEYRQSLISEAVTGKLNI
ncbi:restriction endonuclease subunit S [Elizabethkingia anophelis]|nr:restriction endonuclease subunit S [Elizabethkingia anophelis]